MNLSKEAGKNGGRIEFRCVEKSFSKIYSTLLLCVKLSSKSTLVHSNNRRNLNEWMNNQTIKQERGEEEGGRGGLEAPTKFSKSVNWQDLNF